jgi:hypothetical protein
MVIVLFAHVAETPAGKPTGIPIPAAPVVEIVMSGVTAAFKHNVGAEEGVPTVLLGCMLNVTKPLAG